MLHETFLELLCFYFTVDATFSLNQPSRSTTKLGALIALEDITYERLD